jgi:HJR/Mrr/RecB family endonuclease
VDIVAARLVDPGIPFQMMVQCKRHAASNKVEVSQVREVWAVKSLQGFHQAMIATTSSFTKGAKLQADYWNLDLRDHDAVVQWCKDMGGVPL